MIQWKHVPKEKVEKYLADRGLTIETASANLKRLFPSYTDQKIADELQVGPMIDELLEFMKAYFQQNPDVVEVEVESDPAEELRQTAFQTMMNHGETRA